MSAVHTFKNILPGDLPGHLWETLQHSIADNKQTKQYIYLSTYLFIYLVLSIYL